MNMTDIFPDIQVGEALTHSGLAVFPLYVDSRGGVDYQVAAAALASGLDGIRNRVEPPPHFEGDVYQAKDLPAVPANLAEATDLFEKSSFAREAFGDSVVDHYTRFFRTEEAARDTTDSNWDRKRYFERI